MNQETKINKKLIRKLQKIQVKYLSEGFIILGIFGSVARAEEKEFSDIDILYKTNEITTEKYPGWKFFRLYSKVKRDLEKNFGRKIDLADIDALNEIGKKYILPELVYV